MGSFIERKYKQIFVVIVVLQVIFISCVFGLKKQSFHSDELWSYGFAASSDGGYIFTTYNGKGVKNYYEWVDCDVLKEYITVDKNEIFDYKSVYDNCSYDLHEPFYFYVLHFVLSLFCGTWSRWYGFAINILAFVMIQFFLHRIVMLVTKDRLFSLLSTLYFGFTMGAVNMSIYIRTYALGAAFAIAFVYYSTVVYYSDGEKEWRNLIKAGVFLMLAALTVNLNLVIGFAVTATYCLVYLAKKRYVLMFRYGCSMLIAVLAAIAVFPTTIWQMLYAAGGSTVVYSYPPAWQLKIYWAYLQHDIIGFRNSIWPEMTMTYLGLGIAGLFAILVPLCIVFRKDEWFCKLKEKVTDLNLIQVGQLSFPIKTLFKKRKDFHYPILAMFAAVFLALFVDARVTNVEGMVGHSRRYIFVVYAIYAGFILTFFYFPIKWISKSKKIRYMLCLIAMAVCMTKVVVDRTDIFFFEYNKNGLQMAEIEEDANIIMTIDEVFVLTCTTDKLMDKGHFFATTTRAVMSHMPADYFSIDIKDKPLYVAIGYNLLEYDEEGKVPQNANRKADENEEIAKVYRSNENGEEKWERDKVKLSEVKNEFLVSLGAKEMKYVGTDSLFGRMMELYRVEF